MAIAVMVGFAEQTRRDLGVAHRHAQWRARSPLSCRIEAGLLPTLPQRLEISGKSAQLSPPQSRISATHLRRKASTAKPVTAAAAAPINTLSRVERARNLGRRR